MIDYQEELDRYLEQIETLAHSKEYARAARPVPAHGARRHRPAAGGVRPRADAPAVPSAAQGDGGGGVRGAGAGKPGDAHQRLFQHRAEGGAGRAVSGRRRGHRGGDARQRGHPHSGQGHAGDAQVHQRNSEISGGFRRLHHEHGVPVPEEGHDGGGRLQAHPPHRRRAGDHQHPVRHRPHPPPAGRAVRPRPAAGQRGRRHRGHHGPRRGVGQAPWTTRRTWPRP